MIMMMSKIAEHNRWADAEDFALGLGLAAGDHDAVFLLKVFTTPGRQLRPGP